HNTSIFQSHSLNLFITVYMITVRKPLDEFGNKCVSLLISRLTPFSTSEEVSKYGLDIVVQDDDQTLVSDASLASGVTKLQPLSLWDQLSKSVVVEGNNDVNSIHVERFISLTEGIVIPIGDCQNILRWLDTRIRLLV
ncbi:3397_t:CDS:1, partial [Acaulospora morrowiae]